MAATKRRTKPKATARSTASTQKKITPPANTPLETVGVILFTILALSFLVLTIVNYM